MRNTIRCCISCILPCGALDVIRIVHSDGHVEEIGGSSVSAANILNAYPKHILKKPSSRCPADNDFSPSVPRIVVVPPDAQLKRGHIYFLIPVSSTPDKPPRSKKSLTNTATATATSRKKQSASDGGRITTNSNSRSSNNNNNEDTAESLDRMMQSERYLREIMREKVSTHRERRRGRVGVWRPHLESISESSTTTSSTTTSDHQ